jgi:hypothetical protein
MSRLARSRRWNIRSNRESFGFNKARAEQTLPKEDAAAGLHFFTGDFAFVVN